MDEPTAGQDYQNYMNFMDAILQMPGFEAILFITHDVDLAVIYANRVLLMADGRLVADGPPQEVLSDFDQLRQCRLVPTSLLQANLERFPPPAAFYALKPWRIFNPIQSFCFFTEGGSIWTRNCNPFS